MWRFRFLTYSFLALTIAVCALGRAPRPTFNEEDLEIAEDDLSALWQRTKIFIEWFTDNNSVQWLLLHSREASQVELVDARRRVGIAEMYQLGLLRPQSARSELEAAERLIEKTEPHLRYSVMSQVKLVETEITAATGRVDSADDVRKKDYNKIEADLDRLINRLDRRATP